MAVLWCIIFCLQCSYVARYDLPYERKDPLIIRSDLGNTIDEAAAAYYHIFDRVIGFQSAKLHEISTGGYEISISMVDGEYRALNRDPHGAEVLRDYLRTFDSKYDINGFERKWKVADYDMYGLPITLGEIKKWQAGEEPGCYGSFAALGIIALPLILLYPKSQGGDGDVIPPGPDFYAFGCYYGLVCISIPGASCIGYMVGARNGNSKCIEAIKTARIMKKIEN